MYEPLIFGEVTLLTVGALVSITRFLFAPSEPALPGVGRVSEALFVAASRIVEPFRARAPVAV